jgi:hypothetical protein
VTGDLSGYSISQSYGHGLIAELLGYMTTEVEMPRPLDMLAAFKR